MALSRDAVFIQRDCGHAGPLEENGYGGTWRVASPPALASVTLLDESHGICRLFAHNRTRLPFLMLECYVAGRYLWNGDSRAHAEPSFSPARHIWRVSPVTTQLGSNGHHLVCLSGTHLGDSCRFIYAGFDMWEEEKKFALPCVQDCQVFLAGKITKFVIFQNKFGFLF